MSSTVHCFMLSALIGAVASTAALAQAEPPADQNFTGGALFIYIPDETTGKIEDRSRERGHSVNATLKADGSLDVIIDGKTKDKRTVPSLNGLIMSDDIGVPTAIVYKAATDPCGGEVTSGCDDRAIAVSKAAGKNLLQSSTYGITRFGEDTDATPLATWMGGVYYGTATNVADMPKDLTATYTGNFLGLAFQAKSDISPTGDSSVNVLTGDTSLTADFRKAKVSGKITNLVATDDLGETALDQGLSLKGKIKGNSYTGGVSFIKPNGKSTGSVAHSELSGGFFGTNAAETAGALSLRGKFKPTSQGVARSSDNSNSGKGVNVNIIGSFGATKFVPPSPAP